MLWGSPLDADPFEFPGRAILMAERGMAAEAGTLARCCFENAFFLGTLRKEEDNFLAEMQMADRYSVKATPRWLVRIPDRPEHAPRRAKQRLEGLINEIKQQTPGFEPAKFEALANRAGVADAYVHYAILSREAAHPSAQSLDRHFVRGRGARSSRKCVGAPMPATLTKSG
jgi:hypothetical protein